MLIYLCSADSISGHYDISILQAKWKSVSRPKHISLVTVQGVLVEMLLTIFT